MGPCILNSEASSKEYRKNWARLIQKIYEVDPLTCPKCQGPMRVISFIEDQDVKSSRTVRLRRNTLVPSMMCQVSTILMSSDEALLTTINPSLSSLRTDANL